MVYLAEDQVQIVTNSYFTNKPRIWTFLMQDSEGNWIPLNHFAYHTLDGSKLPNKLFQGIYNKAGEEIVKEELMKSVLSLLVSIYKKAGSEQDNKYSVVGYSINNANSEFVYTLNSPTFDLSEYEKYINEDIPNLGIIIEFKEISKDVTISYEIPQDEFIQELENLKYNQNLNIFYLNTEPNDPKQQNNVNPDYLYYHNGYQFELLDESFRFREMSVSSTGDIWKFTESSPNTSIEPITVKDESGITFSKTDSYLKATETVDDGTIYYINGTFKVSSNTSYTWDSEDCVLDRIDVTLRNSIFAKDNDSSIFIYTYDCTKQANGVWNCTTNTEERKNDLTFWKQKNFKINIGNETIYTTLNDVVYEPDLTNGHKIKGYIKIPPINITNGNTITISIDITEQDLLAITNFQASDETIKLFKSIEYTISGYSSTSFIYGIGKYLTLNTNGKLCLNGNIWDNAKSHTLQICSGGNNYTAYWDFNGDLKLSNDHAL